MRISITTTEKNVPNFSQHMFLRATIINLSKKIKPVRIISGLQNA